MCTPLLPKCEGDESPCALIDCAPGFTCDEKTGECVAIDKDPCAGKECGVTCTTCLPGEICLTVVEFCNADGMCTPEFPKCDDEAPPCSEIDCAPGFECNAETGDCEWDPCSKKKCGDPCSLCSPFEPECTELSVEKFCDEEGFCGAKLPQCGPVEDLCEDFLPPCKKNGECPIGMICSFEGCNPTFATCDPITGEIEATEDCNGGVCVDAPLDPCSEIECAKDYTCNSKPGECEWTPCAGKKCGELCKLCPPRIHNANCLRRNPIAMRPSSA